MHFSKMLFAWRKHEHSQNPNPIHIALGILIYVKQDLRLLIHFNIKFRNVYVR